MSGAVEVWQMLVFAAARIHINGHAYVPESVVQAALMAERERCAAIADSWAATEERLAERDAGTESGITHTLIADGMRDVAAAIRTPAQRKDE